MSPLSAAKVGRIPGLLFALTIILAGCGHEPVRRAAAPDPADGGREHSSQTGTIGKRAASIAVRQIGVPYRYGGNTTSGFDCSGLAQYAYARSGIHIPRTTAEQWRGLDPVAEKDLEVGDILFFRIEGTISHVGLYLGDKRFVHAPSSGREVGVADLNSRFYAQAFVRGGRPR